MIAWWLGGWIVWMDMVHEAVMGPARRFWARERAEHERLLERLRVERAAEEREDER